MTTAHLHARGMNQVTVLSKWKIIGVISNKIGIFSRHVATFGKCVQCRNLRKYFINHYILLITIFFHTEKEKRNMASENVEKILEAMKDSPPLMLEFSLVFAKMEAAAGVKLTQDEKKELLNTLADTIGDEALVAWI